MITDGETPHSAAPHWASRPLIIAAVLTGFVLRLAFGLGYWVDKPLTLDEREYLLVAQNVAAGRGFNDRLPDGSSPPGAHVGRAPLYPLFLAFVMRATGEGITMTGASADATIAVSPTLLKAVKIVQAGLGLVTIWLIALLAFRAAGPKAATIAAWLAAVYPPLVWTPAYVFSETLYSALALGCVAVIDRALQRRTLASIATPVATNGFRAWGFVAAGALAGLAVLTRPAMLFFLGLAVPWLWWKRGLLAAACLLAASALTIAPWTLRNVAEHGRFVLVASEGGVTFWTGNHPLARGEGDLAANLELKQANLDFRAAHPGLSPEQLEPLYYREALSWIAGNPSQFAWLLARKAFYTMVPIGPSYQLHSSRYFWSSIIAYLAVLPFGLLGLVRRAGAVQPLLVLAAASILVCLVFFPQERFRIPIIDPTLLVCAASWWAPRGNSLT